MSSTAAPKMSTDPLGYLRAHPRARKTLSWCGGIALVIGILLWLLPVAVAWYAQDWLRANGAADATIDDVDINLFTGSAGVSGLRAGNETDARLHVGSLELELRWWPLVSRRIHVEALRLSDTQIDVRAGEDGVWFVGGLRIAPGTAGAETAEVEMADTAAAPWGVGSEIVRLTDVSLTYRDRVIDSAVEVNEILLGSHFSWEAGRTADLLVDLTVDGSPLLLKSDIQPWAEERSLAGSLKLEGLSLADYRAVLEDLAGLNAPQGTFDFDLEVSVAYADSGELELTIAGPVEITKAGFSLGTTTLANELLRWDGELRARLPAPQDGSLLQVDGGLELAGTSVMLSDLAIDAALGGFDWRGRASFAPPAEEAEAPNINLGGAITASGLQVRHATLDVLLAAFDSIALSGVEVVAVDQAAVEQINLQGLRLLGGDGETGEQEDVFVLAEADLQGFGYAAQTGVAVQTLVLNAPRAVLVRDAEGRFLRIDDVMTAFTEPPADTEGEPAEVSAPAASSPALPFLLASVEINGKDWVRFEDRSVSPPATFELSTLELVLANIDSTGIKPLDVELLTGDGAMSLRAAGSVNAFAEAFAAEVKVDVANLDLPPLSPYVPGYNIERGRFGTDTTVRIDGDTLDVQNALLIERLQLAGKAADGSDLLAEGMAMPLDVALDLLRDGEDRIQFQLPVSGSLSDPQFGTGDIVRQAMQSAVQNAALSYVKNALQPLGTILLVKDLATKAARPRFEPVEMTPGQAALPDAGRAYVQKIGSMLSERPGLQLTICGVATPLDRQALMNAALAEQAALPASSGETAEEAAGGAQLPAEPQVSESELLGLAEARTEAVIEYLAVSASVDRERLFTCRATLAQGDDEVPRVEITL